MKRCSLMVLLLVTFVIGHVPVALAQAQTTSIVAPEHWTVTPSIGLGLSGDLDSATGMLGVTAGYVWTDRTAFEAEFTSLPSPELGGLVEVQSNVWSLTGNLLYRFAGRDMLVPYAAVGIGVGHGAVDIDGDDSAAELLDDSSTEFVLNFGGGFERSIRGPLAFRGDLRYFVGGDLVPDYWRLGIGLTFDLGRR
jgi:opacity protein-like surface antigen